MSRKNLSVPQSLCLSNGDNNSTNLTQWQGLNEKVLSIGPTVSV